MVTMKEEEEMEFPKFHLSKTVPSLQLCVIADEWTTISNDLEGESPFASLLSLTTDRLTTDWLALWLFQNSDLILLSYYTRFPDGQDKKGRGETEVCM